MYIQITSQNPTWSLWLFCVSFTSELCSIKYTIFSSFFPRCVRVFFLVLTFLFVQLFIKFGVYNVSYVGFSNLTSQSDLNIVGCFIANFSLLPSQISDDFTKCTLLSEENHTTLSWNSWKTGICFLLNLSKMEIHL